MAEDTEKPVELELVVMGPGVANAIIEKLLPAMERLITIYPKRPGSLDALHALVDLLGGTVAMASALVHEDAACDPCLQKLVFMATSLREAVAERPPKTTSNLRS